MFLRIAMLAVAVMSMLASGAVLADDDFERKGVYVSAGALAAFENFSETVSDDLVAGGFDLRLGYRATEVISVETEFAYAGKWTVPPVGAGEVGELNIWTWSFNIKGNVPVGRFSPYGLIGVGMHRSRAARGFDSIPPGQENIGGMLKGAVGIDCYVTRNIVLSPEAFYSANMDGKDGLDFYGVIAMATFRF